MTERTGPTLSRDLHDIDAGNGLNGELVGLVLEIIEDTLDSVRLYDVTNDDIRRAVVEAHDYAIRNYDF